ncbi:MAG: hypothetical protein JNL57_08025 [Bacteroidetes bacterium]|nr:hypothetical protein [Bacteroidota bacterium]
MNHAKPNRPLAVLLLCTGLLGVCVLLFSLPVTGDWLRKNGLQFISAQELEKTYLQKTAAKPAPRKKSVDTASRAQLTTAEKRKLDTLRNKIQFLENFSTKDKTSLSSFFASLSSCRDSVVHIWYYGDSQIEGDRITQDLRKLLQSRFGGSGLGYIPFADVATYRSIELKPSASLIKQNCFTHKSPKGFGFAGKVFKLNIQDSSYQNITGLWIAPSQKFQTLSLLYGKSAGGSLRLMGKDSSLKKSIKLPVTNECGIVRLSSSPFSGNFSVALPAETQYHGFVMDGVNGIQVDNCGIRGHSGDGLSHIQNEVLRLQAAQLNTRLVVFHFGNNMIPYIKPGKYMDYYKKEFQALFSRYKRVLPGCSFLVVSSGDMGTVRNGEEQSYPYIQEFTDMLHEAAQSTDCAFFDMHALMQKDGGILAWVKKGYANLDGHLSPAGQYRFSRILYDELMREYDIFNMMNN